MSITRLAKESLHDVCLSDHPDAVVVLLDKPIAVALPMLSPTIVSIGPRRDASAVLEV